MTTKAPQGKEEIFLDDGMHKFVYEMKKEVEQITNPKGVRAFIGKDSISLSGPQAAINQVKDQVGQLLYRIKSSLYTEFISNGMQC